MKTCANPYYTETELRALPEGAPIAVYGAFLHPVYVSRGRVIADRGTAFKVAKSTLDGKVYFFYRQPSGQLRKMLLSAAVKGGMITDGGKA